MSQQSDGHEEEATVPTARASAASDPQLAALREVTGLEGEALDTLAGRLARLKRIKSGDGPRPPGGGTPT
jgi:hypothetical protein